MKKTAKVRLFANTPLSTGDDWVPEESQTHYLLNVLRFGPGEEVKVFDNHSGEYLGEITQVSKKSCTIRLKEKLRDMQQSPDLWLLFAPVKKDKTDFITAGATELGIRRLVPVITRRTISERVKKERFEAQVIEAAEQSRRLDIPQVEDARPLETVLKDWDKNRILYFMDETGCGGSIAEVFGAAPKGTPAAILVGPEGGFAEEELELLRRLPFAKSVSMGQRILRAETAVQAALSCWQAWCGDWK